MHTRNLTTALTESLAALLANGATVPSRNGETREIYGHQVHIERPQERVIITPFRGVNIFAQLAETLWVIAGRDDMEFLSRYLPRAPDYSDDGKVWRGGYGPRLRAWPAIPEKLLVTKEQLEEILQNHTEGPISTLDQVGECIRLLREDPHSRRAVMIIFDPARDFCETKDTPCNNWIHWLIRDGKLNMTVGVRSNDAIWGFSGINMFEWSVLQQMMAHWVGVGIGTMAYTASSFHLYDYHYEKAQKIVDKARPQTLYEYHGGWGSPEFQTCWEDFGPAMEEFFRVEAQLVEGGALPWAQDHEITDPFLFSCINMLGIYRFYQMWPEDGDKEDLAAALAQKLNHVPDSDLRMGAIDFFRRQKRVREGGFMDKVDFEEKEREFFRWLRRGPERSINLEMIFPVLKELHFKKTQSYGDSWKKHGEVLGMFSNITRKRDRIVAMAAGAQGTADESILDTIADLCVYAGKYLTLIAEMYPQAFADFLKSPDMQMVYPPDVDHYAHTMGFDAVLDMLWERYRKGDSKVGLIFYQDIDEVYRDMEASYQILETTITDKDYPVGAHGKNVTGCAVRLCILSAEAIRLLTQEQPKLWESYVRTVAEL